MPSMPIQYAATCNYKLIYIFRVEDGNHEGLLKIGDATIITEKEPEDLPNNCSALNKAAKDRINTYTNTAGLQYQLLHTELAIREKTRPDGKVIQKDFRDKDVHKVLKNAGIEKVSPAGTTANEWYRTDLETAKRAITAVKEWRITLYAGEITPEDEIEIILREEQKDAIAKTIACFKTGNQMLWNAKMRYGKTVTALSLVKQEIDKYKKVIIITHRPVVESGWRDDFKLIFKHDECAFVTKDHDTDAPEEIEKIDYGNELQLRQWRDSGKPFIYFASIQDLRGSKKVGGKYNKNNAVFNMARFVGK